MPIYDKGYRAFDGAVKRRMRWMTMVRQEWRIIYKRKIFWLLMAPSILGTIILGVYVYLVDIIASAPNHPWASAAQEFGTSSAVVSGPLFFAFISYMAPFVFLAIILAGGGLISNDFRYNLVDIYFSKPLSWFDYAFGKFMILALIGLGATLLPVCILLLLHISFVPTVETLKAMRWIPFQAAGYSLTIVVPSALCTLASSAFFSSQRFAAITVFMVLFINSIFFSILSELVREQSLMVMAFPVAVTRLGEYFFDPPNPQLADISPMWSGVLWGVVCVLAAIVVIRKVRKAGAAA